MSTVANILTAARAYLATLPTSRDAAVLFKEHATNQPFAEAPIAGRDGFEITQDKDLLTSGFGLQDVKEGEFEMVVKLGHAPFMVDRDRENSVSRDIARLTDLFESYTWPTIALPDNVRGVWGLGASTDKTAPNWWLSELRFRVVYIGAKETA